MPARDAIENSRSACPEREVLIQLCHGKLEWQALEAITSHVSTCPRCAQVLSSIDETSDMLLHVLREPLDPDPLSNVECAALVDRIANLPLRAEPESEVVRRTLGRYELLAKLGQGGMGSVYKAMHSNLGKIVALKMLAADRIKDPAAVARMRREMKALGALQHANIVGGHDADEIDGVHFLIMEYVDGVDLGELVRRVGPLPVADACEIIRQAAVGLDYAHRQGLVHRDIKPSNLMLDRHEQVKVLDLGLALLAGDPAAEELTATGSAMGTADYMAPEQAGDSHRVDARADIYSLGCTLFKLLVGHPPFPAPRFDTTLRKMMAHAREPAPMLRPLRPDVPDALEQVLGQALAKMPADRQATAGELASALEPLSQGNRLSELFVRASTAEAIDENSTVLRSSELGTNPYVRSSESPTGRVRRVIRAASMPLSGARNWKAVAAALFLLLGLVLVTWNKPLAPWARWVSEATSVTPPADGPPPRAVAPFNVEQARAHQDAWAKHLGMTAEVTNSIGMKLALIPAGEFLMGSTPEQNAAAREMLAAGPTAGDPYTLMRLATEVPQHRVVISKPFWLCETEVTIGQFQQFISATGYVTDAERYGFGNSRLFEPDNTVTPAMKKLSWRTPGYAVTADSPVTQVTWNDAVRFCNWLSKRENLQVCYREDTKDRWVLVAASEAARGANSSFGYRLPTEAEWEYACRAGAATQFSFGDDPKMLERFGWFGQNSGGRPRAVGLKPPNAFGLFDMHGNVYEWCQDWYAAKYYQQSPTNDPTCPTAGPSRVSRGGYWSGNTVHCRSAYRIDYAESTRDARYGFRPVRASPNAVSRRAMPSSNAVAQIQPAPPLAKAPFDARQARAYRSSWATYLHSRTETTNPVGMRLLLIPPGEFSMGSTPQEQEARVKIAKDAKVAADSWDWRALAVEVPDHLVTISRPFWLGSTEVTVGQFRRFIEGTGYVTDAQRFGFGESTLTKPDDTVTAEMKQRNWRTPGLFTTEDAPVTQVSWNDAVQFCNWLSKQEQFDECYRRDASGQLTSLLASAQGYRLPTEAEWEYACRAGTTTQFSFGDDPEALGAYGWFQSNSKGIPHRVGLKLANPFGLFDMHGNVREWCQDFYAAHYYAISPGVDPLGPATGLPRIFRGGCWGYWPLACRSASRGGNPPEHRTSATGFRVMRVHQ